MPTAPEARPGRNVGRTLPLVPGAAAGGAWRDAGTAAELYQLAAASHCPAVIDILAGTAFGIWHAGDTYMRPDDAMEMTMALNAEVRERIHALLRVDPAAAVTLMAASAVADGSAHAHEEAARRRPGRRGAHARS